MLNVLHALRSLCTFCIPVSEAVQADEVVEFHTGQVVANTQGGSAFAALTRTMKLLLWMMHVTFLPHFVAGRKIAQDRAALQSDAQETSQMAELKVFEAEARNFFAHLESKIESQGHRLEGMVQNQSHRQQEVIAHLEGKIVNESRTREEVPNFVSITRDGSSVPAEHNLTKASEMFEGCKAPRGVQALLGRESAEDVHLEASLLNESDGVNSSLHGCRLRELPLIWKRWNAAPSISCCDVSRHDCSGCERFKDGACKVREPAFVQRPGRMHEACMDITGWVSNEGKTCYQLQASECTSDRVQGTSSKEACCKCGGGLSTASPFYYESDHIFTVGTGVSLWPKPRTAKRYGLTEGCEFAQYGLTLKGATGEVTYRSDYKANEPFKVTCQVTAFQTETLTYTASVTVTVSDFHYGRNTLVFAPHRTKFGLVVPSHTHAKDMKLNCAPEAAWFRLHGRCGRQREGRLRSPDWGCVPDDLAVQIPWQERLREAVICLPGRE